MKYEKQTNQNYETMKHNQKLTKFVDEMYAAIKLDRAVEEDQIRIFKLNLREER